MSACTELAPLFLQRELGVLEEDELDRLEEHLDDCRTCPAWVARLEGELVAAQVPTEEPPPDGWDALEAALDREEQAARLPIRVGLGCTYCHGRLVPESSVYCAGCLAPHHGACFAEHGSCCAPGCGQTSTVARREPPPPAAASRGAPWPVVVLMLLGASAGTAALTYSPSDRSAPVTADAPSPSPTESKSTGPTYEGKTADEWIETLRDHSETLRERARSALFALGEPVSGPPLRRAVAGDDFVLAWRARKALQDLQSPTPIPLALYRRALRQDDLEVRADAVSELTSHSSPEAVLLVAEALRDAHDDPRQLARSAVARRDPRLKRTLDLVLRALRDPLAGARIGAAQLACDLDAIPPALPPALLVAATDGDGSLREVAVQALQRSLVAGEPPTTLKSAALIKVLTRAISTDKTTEVRVAAARCLRALNARHRVDVAALAPALDDASLDVRLHVAAVFGKRRVKADLAVPRLTELIEDGRLGRSAIKTLALFGPAALPAVPNLRAALSKEGSGTPRSKAATRLEIARTFAAIDLPSHVLLALFGERDSRSHLAALEVARRRPELYLAHTAAVRDAAMGALNEPTTTLRLAGAKVLGVLAELERPELKAALPSIAASLGDVESPQNRGALRATLLRCLARAAALDPPLAVTTFVTAIGIAAERWPAVEIMTEAFRRRPLPGLLPALELRLEQGRSWEVLPASCSLLALGSSNPVATSHVERAVLFGTSSTDRRQAVRALALGQHPQRLTYLAQRLADRDSEVRKAAVAALGRAGPVKLLRRRVELEEDEGVLVAIANALAAREDRATLPLLRRRLAETKEGAEDVLVFDFSERQPLARRLAGAMITLGARDPALLEELRWGTPSLLEAKALVLAGEPAGLRALCTWLTDEDPDRRRRVCETLGALGPRARTARSALEKRLKDPWPRVRAAAKAALAALGK